MLQTQIQNQHPINRRVAELLEDIRTLEILDKVRLGDVRDLLNQMVADPDDHPLKVSMRNVMRSGNTAVRAEAAKWCEAYGIPDPCRFITLCKMFPEKLKRK